MADNVKDTFLRKVVANMPDGISIVDDEDHVLNTIVGDPKTNKIKINKSLLGGSSTGGNTGGDDGGHTGGGDNPDNPNKPADVGDDIYPGDLNKGELTNRWQIWKGQTTPGQSNILTFNQDVGNNLDKIGDGLQFNIAMRKTETLNGVNKDRDIVTSNDDKFGNQFLTKSPIPISISKSALVNKKSVTINMDSISKTAIYRGDLCSLPAFKTANSIEIQDTPEAVPVSSPYTYITIGPYDYSYDNIYLKTGSSSDKLDRTYCRPIVFKGDDIVATGIQGARSVFLTGLTPSTKYEKGDFQVAYQNVYNNKISKKVDVDTFTTKTVSTDLGDFVQAPIIKDSGGYVKTTLTCYPHAVQIDEKTGLSNTTNSRLTVFDKFNRIVAQSPINQKTVFINNLDSNTVFGNGEYSIGYVKEDDISAYTKVSPTITFTLNDDQTIKVDTTQGSNVNANNGEYFNPMVESVNTYTIQNDVVQTNVDNFLFLGNSNKVTLTNVDTYLDDINDGIEIEFEDPFIFGQKQRTDLVHTGLGTKIRIPKGAIYRSGTSIDIFSYLFSNTTVRNIGYTVIETYSNGAWNKVVNSPSGSYFILGTYASIEINNKNIEIKSDLKGGYFPSNAMLSYASALPYAIDTPINIKSIKSYKEASSNE